MSRKQNKELANSELVEFQIFPNNCEDNNEEDIEILQRSLQHISEKDRQIIELRFFQKLSWKEVVTYLASTGEILAEVNARQKGKRALERLKKAFLSIKSDKLSA